jgi:hypothetical protein
MGLNAGSIEKDNFLNFMFNRKKYSKIYKEKLMKEGVCVSHPKRRAAIGNRLCQKCLDYLIIRQESHKNKGVCIGHKDRPAVSGKTRCKECLLNGRLYQLKIKGVPAKEVKKAKKATVSFNGFCQSCGSSDSGFQGWCLDHDHSSKKFRGILCSSCNIILGAAGDCIDKISAAANYLGRTSW